VTQAVSQSKAQRKEPRDFKIVPGLGLSDLVSVRERFRILEVSAVASDERTAGNSPTNLAGQTLGDNLLEELDYVDRSVAVYKARRARDSCTVSVRVFNLRGPGSDENKIIADRFEAAPKLRLDTFEQIFETGRKGDLYFAALELLEGETLGERIERDGGLPPNQALDILIVVAEAIVQLHNRGHVHGDLTPDNLFLTNSGQVKILGVNRTRPSPTTLMLGGEDLGNADYLPPERIDGRPLDAASDIYSLGFCFFALLSGRPPFAGNSAMQTMVCQLSQDPPSLRKMADGVSEGVALIFEKMTGKTSDQRYRDTQMLLTDIRTLKSGRESRIEAFKKPEKVERLTKVAKTSLVGAIVLLAALVIAQLAVNSVTILTTITKPDPQAAIPIVAPPPKELKDLVGPPGR
jgi:serine/threonine protein kinase